MQNQIGLIFRTRTLWLALVCLTIQNPVLADNPATTAGAPAAEPEEKCGGCIFSKKMETMTRDELAKRINKFGGNSTEAASVRLDLVNVLLYERKSAEAFAECSAAEKVLSKDGGAELARAHIYLAKMSDQITVKQKEKYARSALDILEKKPNSKLSREALDILGQLMMQQKNYTEAEKAYQHLASTYVETGKSNDREKARALENLAFVYRTQLDFARAIPVLEKALTLKTQACGKSSSETKMCADVLAGTKARLADQKKQAASSDKSSKPKPEKSTQPVAHQS